MAKPVSNEIREKIVQHKQNKVKEDDIAKWLIISKSTVTKVWALYRKTGSVLPRPRTQGRKPAIDLETMKKIEAKIKKTPDVTLVELIAKFNLGISVGALSRHLKKQGYSFKKRRLIQRNETAPMSKQNAENSLKK
jgi:transposase